MANAFESLARDPRRRRPKCDVRKLSGIANAWRLRVGEYRGIYAIEGEEVVSPSLDTDAPYTNNGSVVGIVRQA